MSLLHTASAAIDRLQLLGPTCFTGKHTIQLRWRRCKVYP